MSWQQGDPTVSYLELSGYAVLGLSCEHMGGREIGHSEDEHTQWLERICAVGEHALQLLQHIPIEGRGYTRSDVRLFTARFFQRDAGAQRMFQHSAEKLRIAPGAFPPFF